MLLFLRRARVRVAIVVGLYGFHLMTYVALGIAFYPHLVALSAFLPLERVAPRAWRQPAALSPAPSFPVSPEPAPTAAG